MMDKSAAAMFAGTAILAVATAFMGVASTSIWTLGAEVGKITAKLDNVQVVIAKIQDKVDQIDERLSQKEADPAQILLRMGVPVQDSYLSVKVRNDIYVIPKSTPAKGDLEARGYQLKSIAPTVDAYLVLPASQKN